MPSWGKKETPPEGGVLMHHRSGDYRFAPVVSPRFSSNGSIFAS